MEKKIIAHRGAWKEFNLPQNSIASLKKAIELKCFGTEFDVHLTDDYVIVVNHDHDFYGLNIETTNYKQLLLKEHFNKEKLPTLKEYFSVGLNQNATKLILEIKTSEIGKTDRTKELIDVLIKELPLEANPDNLEFILFDFESALYIKKQLPNYFVNYLEGDKTADEILESGLNGMDYQYDLLIKNSEIIQQFKQNGLKTNSWTVNDIEVARKLFIQQIDCITTDYPLIFQQKFNIP